MDGSKITPENGVPRKEKNQNIQVFVRVRPMNSQEHAKHAAQVIDTPGSREVVVRDRSVNNVTKTFTFDRVFGASSKQVDVYKTVVAPLLNEVLLGYNCTVFAYGQTGTGKTFTMEGERSQKQTVENDPLAGILPRALSQLFDEVRLMNCEFTVRVSFLELYNEELFDLLAPIEESKHKTLRLFEDSNRKGSVIIQGLEEVIVNNKQEVYAVLDRGSQQRRTAATLMNAHSSRSHTVFTITVHMKESSVEGEEMLKVGKLHLVDLAGSENIGKSGAVEKRAREAGSINQSLLTLGRVISALVERTPHIPYRESKLTRLLQDSLGGKTKTSIIATVSPANSNIEETLSTLDYAHRAKNIMNKPEVNQKLTKKEALNIYTDEIERLRRDLCATREKNGVFMDQDNYNRTMCQIGAQHAELNEKSNKIRELEEVLLEREAQAQEHESQIHELQIDVQVKQAMLLDAKNRQDDLTHRLLNSERRSDELKYLVKYHLEAEEKITGEASNLLNTASDSVAVIESLHGRLERKQSIENRNWTNSERFREEYRKSIDEICDVMNELREGHTVTITEIRDIIEVRSGEKNKLVENFNEILNTTYTSLNLLDNSIMDITDKLKDVIECRAAGVAEMMEQQHHRAIESLSGRMKTITDSADAVKTLFDVLHSENKKLQQAVEDKFNRLSADVKETLKNNNRVYDRLDVVLTDVKKKWGDLLNDGHTQFTEFKSTQNQYKDESNRKIEQMRETLTYFMQKTEGMQKTLDDLKSETNNQVDKSVEMFNQFVHDVDTAGNVTDAISCDSIKSIQDARTASHNTITRFSTYKIQNVQEPKQKLASLNEKLENGSNSLLSSVYESVVRTVAEQKSTIEEVINNVGKTTQLYGTVIEDHRLDVSTLVGRRTNETTLLRDTAYNAVRVLSEGEDKTAKALLVAIDNQCDDVSEKSTTANSMLQHAAGNVDEFWEETYLVDTPSGGTPGRRKYDLPSKLTMPSPHNRVMARYRLLSKDVKTAIDDGPDDLNCSWSDGYFKNLKLPIHVVVVPTNSDAETEPESEVGTEENDNVENQDPSGIPFKKLDTIAESVEAKDVSKNSTAEYVDDVTPEQSQEVRAPAPPETPKKKNKARRKSGGKKGVLKSTN